MVNSCDLELSHQEKYLFLCRSDFHEYNILNIAHNIIAKEVTIIDN
jgi:hypothetical protein